MQVDGQCEREHLAALGARGDETGSGLFPSPRTRGEGAMLRMDGSIDEG